ncbi:MAG: hypothetical protein P1U34_11430 [Coxiellaceae bacterium]|nr:hypothetical protein [Coxiellaceae bacterium]
MRPAQLVKPMFSALRRVTARSETMHQSLFTRVRYHSVASGGFDYYNEIVGSLPSDERAHALNQIDSDSDVNRRSDRLSQQVAEGEFINPDKEDGRTLLLSSLKLLKEGRVSVAELASIHMLDSAVRTLISQLMMFSLEKKMDSGGSYNELTLIDASRELSRPKNIYRFPYNAVDYPASIGFGQLPGDMRLPLVKRFFHFTDDEWLMFCEKMQSASPFEQYCYAVSAPEKGFWSLLIQEIQDVLECFQTLYWLRQTEAGGLVQESIMLVPSFTMFQAALEVKAHTLNNRVPIHLVPTYGYLGFSRYKELKSQGLLAMAMYLPEFNRDSRYRTDVGEFRTTIDGYPYETAYAGAVHDMYHGFREMAMSENVARARMRLAAIARRYPDSTDAFGRTCEQALVDGELIYSYSQDLDTVFKRGKRSHRVMCFGELFHIKLLQIRPELREAFIEDMVHNATLWRDEYGLGRDDLVAADQLVYDEIVTRQNKLSSKNCLPTAWLFGGVPMAKPIPDDSAMPDKGLIESPGYKP